MTHPLEEALEAWSASDTQARRAARAAMVTRTYAALDLTREAWQAVDILARKAKRAHALDDAPADPAIVAAEREAWRKYKAAQRACLALNTLKRGATKGGY